MARVPGIARGPLSTRLPERPPDEHEAETQVPCPACRTRAKCSECGGLGVLSISAADRDSQQSCPACAGEGRYQLCGGRRTVCKSKARSWVTGPR